MDALTRPKKHRSSLEGVFEGSVVRLQHYANSWMTVVAQRGLECTGEARLAVEQRAGRKRTKGHMEMFCQ